MDRKVLEYAHSNESYQAVLSFGAVCYVLRFNFISRLHAVTRKAFWTMVLPITPSCLALFLHLISSFEFANPDPFTQILSLKAGSSPNGQLSITASKVCSSQIC